MDAIVFFKLMLMGRLENIGSDRRLIEQCALRLSIFERLFNHVFTQGVAAGLVTGYTQAVDSANAPPKSSSKKQPAESPALVVQVASV